MQRHRIAVDRSPQDVVFAPAFEASKVPSANDMVTSTVFVGCACCTVGDVLDGVEGTTARVTPQLPIRGARESQRVSIVLPPARPRAWKDGVRSRAYDAARVETLVLWGDSDLPGWGPRHCERQCELSTEREDQRQRHDAA